MSTTHIDTHAEPAALARPVKQFIVLLAMLQGLLLYVAEYGREAAWWPFSTLNGCVYWYTLVLAVPTMMLLSVRRLDERRFWWQATGVAVMFALLAAWAGWSATGNAGIVSDRVLWPFGLATAVALFVALPYLQSALRHGRWNARYADLFELAWQNGLTLVLMLLFIGICWPLLYLWGGLFQLIGIEFFADLFREKPFVYLATGLMAGLGILIGRTQQRPVQIARRVLLAIFTGLLPLVALIALLFVLSLPLTGLEPLWNTRSAALILMSVVAVMVLFVNAVYQDGQGAMPYPRWLRWLVDAGILTLPWFSGLALYALMLRINQYGWTQERIAGMVAAVILASHALGYAIAVLRRGSWLSGIRRVNVAVSLLAIVLAVLFNSPVLDPHRITVNSQLARLTAGKVESKDFDLRHLRFYSGRQGWLAMQGLQKEAEANGDVELAKRIVAVLQRSHAYQNSEELAVNALKDAAALREVVQLAAGSPAPADDWWMYLLGDKSMTECKQIDSDCVLLVRDFDRDGQADHLLCDASDKGARPLSCQLFSHHGGSWRSEGELSFWDRQNGNKKALSDALRRGEITLYQPRWPMIGIDGQRSSVSSKNADAFKEIAQ
ncbi:DUF4153 domain-containing protein [Lysobacteraceae bacterium NML75-0749]|nr:DUF4153 domain-containing protein [Xanthomonadaceae bacterium NML75-0749]PJK04453.1 DUF4153 domain-containing protein [Xanthomonadaceae bacterium NML91-0268]